ncbi:MAG: methyltransferase domain-containing protein [Bacteroidota bacterium]|nr:methyltransferase domain-containing protein [Bacteroidota bacterium]
MFFNNKSQRLKNSEAPFLEGRLEESDWFSSDIVFNSLYPEPIQVVAEKHWTPLAVAVKAATFLAASPDVKVLDIGSGSGKFCLTAAHYHPRTNFHGIEQRSDLVALCNTLKEQLELKNVYFDCDNITNVDFKDFDHFYFYNSFYENIEGTQKIDYNIEYSEDLYDLYNRYLYKQLKNKPSGTRLVTYHSFGTEIPKGFEVVNSDYNELLKFWIKV